MMSQDQERKLVVIRTYLLDTISESTVEEGPLAEGERTLILRYGGTGSCTIQISTALLSDKRPTPMELQAALKQKNMAGKILARSDFYLTHVELSSDSEALSAQS